VRRLTLAAVIVTCLVLGATAAAGTTTYAGNSYWPAGQPGATWFSPSWFQNVFYKTSSFDTTLTFIDAQTYRWHSTVRGWGTYQETHWLSSENKKAHCHANTTGSSWAACTAYN